MEQRERELIDALSVLGLRELCSYIDLEGNPVICDWVVYEKLMEEELNKYKLTREQFELIKQYLEEHYKGKL